MTTISDSPEIELLHRASEAMTGGDFAVLEESLAEVPSGMEWRTGSSVRAVAPVLPPPLANHDHFGGE
jgi:hypothetical protein